MARRYMKITHAPRRYSAWMYITRGRQFDACCDCGLVHVNQYRVIAGTKPDTVQLLFRTKKHKAETKRLRASKRHPMRARK